MEKQTPLTAAAVLYVGHKAHSIMKLVIIFSNCSNLVNFLIDVHLHPVYKMSLSICSITKMYCHDKVIRGGCLLGVAVINSRLIYNLENKWNRTKL